ncbi:MAG: L,D-transpeptidase [Paludibacteraceae bacterium]|nr:L,D-transpeptidase [Paludibacteraceae bacterium]MBP5742969.1 L,D-transpeptidase [Paludibacteraceae bacterium]
MKLKKTAFIAILGLNIGIYGCSANNSSTDNNVNTETSTEANNSASTYTDDVRELVGMDHGKRTVRIAPDVRISHPELRKNQANRFIVMSKKDYYLYVYEGQGADTVLLARYDCAFSQKKGNKQQRGDMKTPHCTMTNPFKITEIKDASSWVHDFGDGRGAIKSYGNYFLRLLTDPHKGIGIHGSTNNEESVPGRASEGCIRLKDEDIIDLRKNYAFVGMKVVIKAEDKDDLPFETRVFEKQNIKRLRHLDPSKTLSNEQIQKAPIEFKTTK